jgi:DNA-binding SARP family transcriptional activator
VLRLTKNLGVDMVQSRALACRLIDGETRSSDIALASIGPLSLDLLPEWNDHWLTVESEDWRQLRLHALDALSAAFLRKGRFADAVAAALAAVRGDDLRETARLALVKAHLAENNLSEALREFRRYRDLLHHGLGLEPSHGFVRLIESVGS